MKNSLILFLAKFFISYLLMVIAYNAYLNKTQEKENLFTCAPITKDVTSKSIRIIKFLGYKATMVQHDKELSFKVFVNNKYVVRIIEGCNSISVIILFLAFIIAFSGSFKATLIFGAFGSLAIYVINFFRIAIISIAYLEYPKYQDILHDLVFPALIYGIVVILWLIWINKFSTFNKTKNA